MPIQADDVWVEVPDDESGEVYYWNPRTNETSWEQDERKRALERLSPRTRRVHDRCGPFDSNSGHFAPLTAAPHLRFGPCRTEYYQKFLGPAEAAARAKVEVDEELVQEAISPPEPAPEPEPAPTSRLVRGSNIDCPQHRCG